MVVASVFEELQNDLMTCIGVEAKALPVRYLGVPLIYTKLKARDCEEIKLKILKRIQSWIARILSYTGRL